MIQALIPLVIKIGAIAGGSAIVGFLTARSLPPVILTQAGAVQSTQPQLIFSHTGIINLILIIVFIIIFALIMFFVYKKFIKS